MFARAALIALCVVRAESAFRQRQAESGVVQALEFQHHLRVCNAYPFGEALEVIRGKSEKLTGDDPMPYKSCREFAASLKSGDKLEFKVGDATAGTFAVSELPQNDAVLLLVIHRHDTVSTAAAFESHIFANLKNAQVAIIDTYKGSKKATPRIMDEDDKSKKIRSEELRFNSVVAVNPGKYVVDLAGEDGEEKAKSELVALQEENYVVIRTGVESQQGQAYPQDLIIYPHSNALQLHSGSVVASPAAFLIFALVSFAMLMFQA